MSLKNVEHINISNIKEETNTNCSSETIENKIMEERKCGDVFHSAMGEFIFCCYYCNERHGEIEEFIGHIERKHLNGLSSGSEREIKCQETDENDDFEVDNVSDSNSIKIENQKNPTEKSQVENYRTNNSNQCKICSKSYRFKAQLKAHLRHHAKELFTASEIEEEKTGLSKISADQNFSDEAMNEKFLKTDNCYVTVEQNIIKNQLELKKSIISDFEKQKEILSQGKYGSDEIFEQLARNSTSKEEKDEKLTECKDCSKIFHKKYELQEHMRSHTGEKLKCTVCPSLFKRKNSLVRHVQNVHKIEATENAQPLLEDMNNKCEEKFNKNSEIEVENKSEDAKCLEIEAKSDFAGKTPTKKHCKDRPFKCSHCPVSYLAKPTLLKHLRLKHDDFTGTSIWRLSTNKEKHTKSIEVGMERKFHCEICDRKFSSGTLHANHMALHQPLPVGVDPELEKKQKSLVCRYCGKHLKSDVIRRAHEGVHIGAKPFKCASCPKSFITSHKLQLHTLTHTGDRPHKCPHCTSAFALRTNLMVHQRRFHLNERRYKCELCEKRFVTSTEQQKHMRHHRNERPFQCEECGKSFVSSGLLTDHKRRHTNTRPHVCTVCQKGFFKLGSLRIHMTVHTKEKPFTCDICTAAFPRKSSLLAHKKLHSDVKNYVCKICEKAFAQCAGLYSHMKSHGVIPKVNKNDDK